jgi:hypothetical protein
MRLQPCFFLPVLLGVFAGSPSAANNPVPHIDTPLVPTSAAPGGPAFTLTVHGSGFVPASVVNWNGSPRTTTFITAGQLTAAIPASDVATATTAAITVTNPAPGGGLSNVTYLTVTTTASTFNMAGYALPPQVSLGGGHPHPTPSSLPISMTTERRISLFRLA